MHTTRVGEKDESSCNDKLIGTGVGRFRGAFSSPQFEILILLISLAGIVGAKSVILHRLHVDNLIGTSLAVSVQDMMFIGGLVTLLSFLSASWPTKIAGRLSTVVVSLVAFYAVVNVLWILGADAQIHPQVIGAFGRAPAEFGNLVWERLWMSRAKAFGFLGVILACEVWLMVLIVRPRRCSLSREVMLRQAVFCGLITMFAALLSPVAESVTAGRVTLRALATNAHWTGIVSLFSGESDGVTTVREIPRRGERVVGMPEDKAEDPNLFVLVLESTAYWATGFGHESKNETPTLESLAAEGVFLCNTRARVTHTTKSMFAMITGETPTLDANWVETVPVDPPYESLATILKSSGYSSRFCQMARGSFESRPGLVANLGFDSFFARDNLEDESKNLGYLGGDDVEMIGPTFDWVGEQAGPVFVVMLTSVGHDPYEVPAWYGESIADKEEAFLQSIRYTDAFVERVRQAIEELPGERETVLCVIGDHGEAFSRHGPVCHNENPKDAALKIPWIIHWPGRIEAGTVIDQPSSGMDVSPTLLALLGYDISKAGFSGRDMLSGDVGGRRVPFSGWYANSPCGYVAGDKKLVYWPRLDHASAFDLVEDPGEQCPLSVSPGEQAELSEYVRLLRRESRIYVPSEATQRCTLFEHWQLTSSGDGCWAYYEDGE